MSTNQFPANFWKAEPLTPPVPTAHVSYEDAAKRGKRYGKAHGFEGGAGGYIWRTDQPEAKRPVCQGWMTFFHKNRTRIELWEASLG